MQIHPTTIREGAMPELWFLPVGDPDGIPPVLPLDALEALADTGDRHRGPARPRDWTPGAMGFAPDTHDNGDALAAAMGGAHLEISLTATPIDLDDLIDPWAMEPDFVPTGYPFR
jgi:hypothetical protein